jgi:hypothetical protein
VNHQEFKKGLEHLGVKLDDKQFEMLLKLVDQDGSGSVDYLEFSNVLKGQDMQVGMQVGGSVDPKLAKMRAQAAPTPEPAPASARDAAAPSPAASARGSTGPPKLPVGFVPPGSSGSYRSNASDKKRSARAASRQSDIDSVRDLPM